MWQTKRRMRRDLADRDQEIAGLKLRISAASRLAARLANGEAVIRDFADLEPARVDLVKRGGEQ